MPQFVYSGFRGDGEAVSGRLDAISEQAALDLLDRDGVIATEFGANLEGEGHAERKARTGDAVSFLSRGVPLATRTLFIRELATFVHADIPLLEALDVLRRQETHQRFAAILSDVHRRVHGGEMFSQALSAHPDIFSPLYVNMIRVGESGGMLASVLEQLATWMEHEEELRGEIRGALTYPLIIVLMGVATVVILFGFVLPKITSVFTSDMPLPWITRALMGTADMVRNGWWLILLAVMVVGLAFWRILKSDQGKALLDRGLLMTPLIGSMMRKSAIARWARASAALLGGGVPLLETLNVVRGLLNNSVMVAMIETAIQRVTQGQSLASSVGEHNLLPPAVVHLLGVGERTGRLAEMFERVAQMAERQLHNQIRVVLNLLPPLLIMALAIMVATIAMAILLPIFKMNTMMR